jgi:hypothetical protein
MRRLVFILLYSICSWQTPVMAQIKSQVGDAAPLHRAEEALTDVIVHDIFSPPVASRIYVYSNIAAYSVLPGNGHQYPKLSRMIKGFPAVDKIAVPQQISYPVAAIYAFSLVAKSMVFSEQQWLDSTAKILKDFKIKDKAKYERSLQYGKAVADTIIAWAATDNYLATRKLRKYTPLRGEGYWIPTPPAYIAAVESYWGRIRPMILDSANQFAPPPPCKYSNDTSSEFYLQSKEVADVGKNLSAEQRDIALFWDCNPFFVNTNGHLMFATKKLSPGGHWMSIAGQAARQRNASLTQTAAAYTFTAIALFDGFISCWDEKYRSNVIRPESYINSHIDESWRPLLQTPPFPEYTSGHSVISTAAAMVLSRIFGDSFHFDDSAETGYGLPVRTFNSFGDAAAEAAISRFYGGIHYKASIENGQKQGEQVGRLIVGRLEQAGGDISIH